MKRSPKESLLEKVRFELSGKSGGGLLCFEVWGYREQGKTVVTRYNIAYIDHALYGKDNGRVSGYDNAHGHHHRHFMGAIEHFDFTSYEAIVERFQQEWSSLVSRWRGKLT